MSALWAIGLMSGTSMDGIDAALIKSDGEYLVKPGQTLSHAYDEAFRARLRAAMGERGQLERPVPGDRRRQDAHDGHRINCPAGAGSS